MNKAPLGAMLLGLLHLLSAAGLALCALVAPFLASAFIGSWGRQNLHWDLGAFGAGLLIAGALVVGALVTGSIGMGLLRARNWARLATLGLSGVGFMGALGSFTWLGLLWYGGVIFYMTRPGVVRAFR